jgi:hypothetical protein
MTALEKLSDECGQKRGAGITARQIGLFAV